MPRRAIGTTGLADGPDPVDTHVGKRLKLRRQVLNVSQHDLADAVGVTFQQIQKYESGHNRVSASRLYQIAVALKVGPAFFFEDLGTAPIDEASDPMRSTRAIEVVRLFNKMAEDAQGPFIALLKAVTTRAVAPTDIAA